MLRPSGGEHPFDGGLIDSIHPATATEKIQEIRSAFALRAEKSGKARVSDMGAISIATLMTGAGVVDLNEGRMRDSGHEHGDPFNGQLPGLLLQNGVDLPSRDHHAEFSHLLKKTCLRQTRMMMLVQQESTKVGTEVITRNTIWQRRQQHAAIGQLPPLATIPHRQWRDHQILQIIKCQLLKTTTLGRPYLQRTNFVSLQRLAATTFTRCLITMTMGRSFLFFDLMCSLAR